MPEINETITTTTDAKERTKHIQLAEQFEEMKERGERLQEADEERERIRFLF